MTYSERVQAIAEEMARSDEPYGMWTGDKDSQIRPHLIRMKEQYARIAVKHMAIMFSSGYGEGAKWGWNDFRNRVKNLQEGFGLIPDNTKE